MFIKSRKIIDTNGEEIFQAVFLSACDLKQRLLSGYKE
jgi:hypothetical protein